MMEAQVELLFDEFAVRYARGEHPDVREYLERAGSEREELGNMIDRYLQTVPARQPTEEDVVLMQALLDKEPPLLVLRLRRKLTRDAVVNALVKALGLDPAKSKKVDGYYHQLEIGQLDPKRVDLRLWDALGDLLQANVRGLADLRREPLPAPAPAYRRYRGMELHERVASAMPAQRDEPDEIDRLFTAGA